MREEYLHYIWKFSLFDFKNLRTSNGEAIEIVNKGTHNTNAGPDFLNARIKIDETLWVGNVELHVKASDWDKHSHQKDSAYDNVILHVVLLDDKQITNSKGNCFPTLSLSSRIDLKHYSSYQNLVHSKTIIACEKYLPEISELKILAMKDRMIVNRLQRKTQLAFDALERTKNDYAKVFYEMLASNFGFKVNAAPFEELAKRLPLNIIQKNSSERIKVEALVFGVAGFLEENYKDAYPKQLVREFMFLKEKYKLESINKSAWKFMRLRPSNFPTIRLAQFASFLFKNKGLKNLLDVDDIKVWKNTFKVFASEYWNDHSQFDKLTKYRSKALGDASIDNILINTISRFLFVRGMYLGNDQLKIAAFNILQEISSEDNSIVRKWKSLGIEAKSALDSQSLIELKNEWCENKKCLNCSIGVSLIHTNENVIQ